VAARRSRSGVLDVTELDFVDVAGMRAIARACQTLVHHAGQARIRGASPTFRRIWRLAEFDRVESFIEVT
jgi:anti-anti-sigma factor